MHEEMSDEALMLAYRDGDAAAFEALYRRWRSRLYRHLLRQCGNGAQADELFQDIWLKVVNARKGYEAAAKFSTWLFRIAHNRLIDHYRAQGRAHLASYDDDPDDDAAVAALPAAASQQPEALLERKALAQELVRHIEALPAAQRETFLLSEEGELTLEEIAAATGTNRETAKSRLRYAVSKLRSALKDLK
ncbi:MAG: RNA polymerase sigma factor [Rhodocyclaceae bacterium]|jgi:RNA polymerase sigma factor (sigma-70 family)|nr:ECF RNA polymerase sigma-E factor [Rhodocyclaceae bacterium]MBZ0145334.1 RNA polymerase sigma factor [Rhodocyclaceae bacterium]MCC6879866.1 RNA polymerase sigma factor [Rhodocyclaceae bacterium]MCL4682702.1 RNA polymerase sigma factor [Rhodocyclaceae bacterium]